MPPIVEDPPEDESDDDDSDELETGDAPFPFSVTSIITLGVVGVTKLAASGVGLVSSVIAIWGVIGPSSWLVLAVYIPVEHMDRRLIELDSDDFTLTLAWLFISIGLCLHMLCNITFMLFFCIRITRDDPSYAFWRQMHRCNSVLTPAVSLVFSFHCIRFLFAALCNLDACKATFSNKVLLLRTLTRFTYLSIVGTCVPMIVAQILLMSHFSISELVWMLALDSLIVTTLLLIFLIIDARRFEKDIYKT